MPLNEYDDLIKSENVPDQGNPYFAEVDNLKKEDAAAVQASMYAAKDADPVRQKSILDLSKKTNLPAEFVERNYDDLAKEYSVQGNDYADIAKNNPATAQFLKDPSNAKLAKDDIDGIKKVDNETQRLSKISDEPPSNFWGDMAHAADSGVNSLIAGSWAAAAAYGLVDHSTAAEAAAEYNKKVQEAKNTAPTYAKELQDALAKEGADVNFYWREFLNSYEDKRESKLKNTYDAFINGALTAGETVDLLLEAVKRPKALAYLSAEQVGNMLPSIGGGIAGGFVGGPIGFAVGTFAGSVGTEIGGWFNQELSNRGFDTTNPDDIRRAFQNTKMIAEIRAQAERKGFTTAAVDTALTAFGGRIARKAATGVAGKIAQAGKAVALDMAGESISEAAGQVAAYEGDLAKINIQDVIQEGLLSLGHSTAQQTTLALSESKRALFDKDPVKATEQLVVEKDKAIKTLQQLEGIQKVSKAVNELKNVKDVPEKVQQIVDTATGGEGSKSVYFQTDDWDNYWSKKGESPAQKAEDILGVNAQKYTEAKQTGMPIEIGLGEFVSKTATTGDLDAMLGITRVLPDGPVLQEALETLKALPETLRDLGKEITEGKAEAVEDTDVVKAELSEIRQTFEDQLVALGRDTKLAKQEAKVFEASMRTLAERTGQTPKQLFDQFQLRVAGKQEAVQGQTYEQGGQLKKQADGNYTVDDWIVKKSDERNGFSKGDEGYGEWVVYRGEDWDQTFKTLKEAKEYLANKYQKQAEAAAPQPADINSPEFKKWFGDSKVVDENGKPLVVYHGGVGADTIEMFDTAYSGQTTGNNTFEAFHFTDNTDVAQDYSRQAFNRRYQDDPEGLIRDGIVKELPEFSGYKDQYAFVEGLAEQRLGTSNVYLSIQNPIVIDLSGERVDVQYIERLTNFAKNGVDENGEFEEFYTQAYGETDENGDQIGEVTPIDGIIIKNMVDDIGEKSRIAADQFILWDNTKIKSVYNRGTFSPTAANIYYQTAPTVSPLGFYSKLEKTIIDKMATRQSADSLRAMLKDIKGEEMKWLGLDDYLKGKDTVTKDEVLAVIRANQLGIEEVVAGGEALLEGDNRGMVHRLFVNDDFIGAFNRVTEAEREAEKYRNELGDDALINIDEVSADSYNEAASPSGGTTKYSQYVEAGGENYREIKFILPPRVELPSDDLISKQGKLGKLQDDRVVLYDEIKKQVNVLAKASADAGKPSYFETIRAYSADYVQAESDVEQERLKLKTLNFVSNELPSLDIDIVENYLDLRVKAKHLEQQIRYAEVDVYNLEKERTKETFTSSHFDEKNILAHTRVNDRVDSDGKKVLFVEEIQSDWLQKGRQRGHVGDAPIYEQLRELVDEYEKTWKEHQSLDKKSETYEQDREPLNKKMASLADKYNRLLMVDPYDRSTIQKYRNFDFIGDRPTDEILKDMAARAEKERVPDAPFKGDLWMQFTLKRLIRMAAEQGYDKIAWTTGEQQVERYANSIESLAWVSYDPETKTVTGEKVGGGEFSQSADEKGLDNLVGKEIAKLLIEKPNQKHKTEDLGKAIRAGGEHLRLQYDQKMPSFLKKFGKKFGASVGETSIKTGLRSMTVPESLVGDARRELKGLEFDDFKINKNESDENRTIYDNGTDTLPRIIVRNYGRESMRYSLQTDTVSNLAADSMEELKDLVWGAEPDRVIKTKVHSLEITPELRAAAIDQGFELFQDKQGRISFGPDKKFLIEIFNNKNPTTVMHELGHYYLEVMGGLAAAEDAPQQIKDDFAQILKWLGVEKREDIGVDQHEQWARGIEAYLMEGKAPSLNLKKIFYRFKTWFVSVYKTVRGLNVTLNDDVRNVMDRIFATDQEIEQASGAIGLYDTDPTTFGMTGDKAEKYIEARENARMAAEEELGAEIMDGWTRQEKREWKAKRKGVRAEIEAQVNQMPVYRAMSVLQHGKFPDGTPVSDNLKDLKLSREILISTYDAEFVKRLPKPFMYAREGGVHPDIVAEAFGFESGDDMLTQMSNALPRKEYIEKLTDARMQQENPELLTDGTLEKRAIEVLHNDHRAKMLRYELDHMYENAKAITKETMRRAIRMLPADAVVKAEARKAVGQRAVKDLKPHLFLSAQKKARAEAAKLFTAGELDGAYEQKYRELLLHEMYRSSLEARDKMKKDLQRFKKFFKKDEDLAKTRDLNIVMAGRAILAEYGLGEKDVDAQEYLRDLKAYDPDAYETVSALVESALDGAGPYKGVSVDKFVEMSETVMSLWDLSKELNEIEIDGKRMKKAEALEAMSAQLAEVTKEKKSEYTETASKWDKTMSGILSFRSALTRVESWADYIDRGKKSGPFKKYLYNPVKEASNQYKENKRTVIERYLEIVKGIEKTLTQDPISAPEIKHKFRNKSELLAALLHTGNESNLSKLLRGWGWGTTDDNGNLITSNWQKFLDRAHKEGLITKADWDYVQAVWDLNESLKPAAQRAHKKMYGFYFNEITAQEVVTPFGTYRGGYMPAVADSFLVEDAGIRQEREQLEKQNNSFMFPTTGRGFTKSRVDQYAAKLSLDLALVPSHLDKVMRFVFIEPTIKDVGRLVTDKGFRSQLALLDETAGAEMLMPWLQRSAQQVVVIPSQGKAGKAFDRFWKELRTRAGMNVMFLNVTNTMQQATGLFIASVKVKPMYLRNALWRYVRSPKMTAQTIQNASPFMNTRTSTQLFDMQKHLDDLLLDPSKYEQARDYAKKNAYWLQSGAQNVVDNIVWLGAYDEAIAAGDAHKDAVAVADRAVRATQGSFDAEDISRAETGTPFMRMFTMFYSYFNMNANLLGFEFAKTMQTMGLKKGAGRMLYIYMFGFMLPAVVSEMIVKAMSGKFDEDDDDEYMDDFLSVFFGSQQRTLTAMVPAVGQAINTGFNFFNDKWYDDKLPTSPAVSMIESAVRSPKSVYEAIANEGNKKTAVRDTLTAVGLLTGLPVAPLSRPIGYMIDVQEGKAQPEGAIDFTRGLVTGKSGQ